MASFPLHIRSADYQTEHGQVVTLKRGYSLCELPGASVLCDAFFDSAAPLSIVPYTLSQYVTWKQLGTQLTRTGSTSPSVLTWQGIPCDLGTFELLCVHLGNGMRSSLLHSLANFPRRPGPISLERALVLGLTLLDENPIRLVLDHMTGRLTGYLEIP